MLNLLTLLTVQFSDNILIIATQASGKRILGTPKSWVHFKEWFFEGDSKTF